MPRKKRRGRCTFCLEQANLPRDHVPPQSLFPSPRPSDLITVPACQDCNGLSSLDDEYLRFVLVSQVDTRARPEVANPWEKAFRGLWKPEKRRFRKAIQGSIAKKAIFTEGGIYLGERGVLTLEFSRLERVLEKTVRGVFFHRVGQHLGKGWLFTFAEPSLWPEHEYQKLNFHRAPHEKVSIGEGIFLCRFAYEQRPRHASVWQLVFYKEISFVVSVLEDPGSSACLQAEPH